MLLPFIWIAAFFFSLPLVEPYEIARLLGVLCAGGAFVYAFWTGAAGLPRSPVLAVAGLFWVLTGISVAFSAVPFVSFVAFCSFSLLPLSALCFLCAPDRVRAINRAAAGAGVILAALALWAVGQYLFVPDMLVYGQVRYPFANPNSYAALMAAGVFPALGVMCSAGTRNVRIAAGALAVLLLVAVMVIGGRAVPLALVAVLIVFVMMVPRLSWRGRGGIVLLMAGAMALGTAIAVMGGAAAIARLDHNMLGTALFGRGPIWESALAIAGDHPWLGTGLGTFFLYYPQYRLPADIVSGGLMAHNDALQFWAELGTAGVILFYGFIAAALWRMKTAWTGRNVMGVALFCGLGVLVAHSHVDFDFYVASILCLSGLMLAWWMSETAVPEDGALIPPAWARKAVAVPVVVVLVLLQGLLMAEMHVGAAQEKGAAGDMEGFAAQVNLANKAGFGLNARAYVMAATVPMGILEQGTATPEEQDALRAQVTKLLGRAEKLNPRLVGIPYYKAQLAKEPAAAIDFLLEALRVNPQHLPSRMMLAEILHKDGKKDEAYAVMRKGLDWLYVSHDPTDFYEIVAARALIRDDQEGYERAVRQLESWKNYKLSPPKMPEQAGLF